MAEALEPDLTDQWSHRGIFHLHSSAREVRKYFVSRLDPATISAEMQAVITGLAPEGWTLQSALVPKGDMHGHTPTADAAEALLLVVLHVWSGWCRVQHTI